MQKRDIRIGLIGFGAMGKAHAYAIQNMPLFLPNLPFTAHISGICTQHTKTAEEAAKVLGTAIATTNENDLINHPDIDVIDICTPNAFHYETACRALAAGKHIYCEKPFCSNAGDAQLLAKAAQSANKICTVVYNNRHLAAISRAKEIIENGRLGRILHFDFSYLHNSCTDPERYAGWKQDATLCGAGGVLFDLGSHILDLAVFLCGKIKKISGHSQIAYPTRLGMTGNTWHTNAPEAFYMLLETNEGAHGTLTASKLCLGTNDDLSFSVYGEKGALRFSLMDPDFLAFYDTESPSGNYGGERGFTRIECVGRYPSPAGKFPSPKAPTGWLRGHLMSMYHFLDAVNTGSQNHPSFDDAAYIQLLMDLALQSAADGKEKQVPG